MDDEIPLTPEEAGYLENLRSLIAGPMLPQTGNPLKDGMQFARIDAIMNARALSERIPGRLKYEYGAEVIGDIIRIASIELFCSGPFRFEIFHRAMVMLFGEAVAPFTRAVFLFLATSPAFAECDFDEQDLTDQILNRRFPPD